MTTLPIRKKYFIVKKYFLAGHPKTSKKIVFQWWIYIYNAHSDSYEALVGSILQKYKEAKKDLLSAAATYIT